MNGKITLADVANLANVSVGTASEALNNKPGISESTRVRIREAARQLGYDQRLNLGEKSGQEIKTIGVIKHEQHDYPGFDPFYAPVVSGIERQCQEDGQKLLYNTCQVDVFNRVTRLPATLMNTELDGLVIVGAYLGSSAAREIRALKCPVVLVDGYAEGARFDRVLTNNIDGAYDIVSFLIQNGHRHIGLIGSSEDPYPSIRERQEGYLKALARNNIQDVYIRNSVLNREAAYEATLALLQASPQLTALFAVNDNAAFGAINALRSLNYEVPEQISVVGFDDIFFAQDMVPPLTTMHIDKIRMGQIAVTQLDYRAQNPKAPVMTVTLDAALTVRKSVKNLKARRETGHLA